MVAVQRGLLVLMAAGALALPSQVPVGSGDVGSPVKRLAPEAPVTYSASQREAYLTPDQLDYIRPGLRVTINSVANVSAGQKPIVDFSMTDDFGNPLDRTGATTPGTVTYRFTVATWDGTYYKNQIVTAAGIPSRDNTGKTDTIDIGHYKYTFAAALPATFDASKAATLFCGAVRNTTAIVGKNYYAQVFKDFVPSTGAAATTWGVTTTTMCNACHTPDLGSTASPHGGNYREAKTCALCHNPNNMVGSVVIDADGSTLAQYNGQVFWHQLHAGISEFGDVTFPRDLRTCKGCHDPAAPQGSNWYSLPSRAACGSCHTDIDWTTGKNHSADNLPQPDDKTCATCHVPQGDAEWDASVIGAHTLPYDSKQLKGLNIKILSVTNAAPGKKPTVTFTLKQNDGTSIKQVAAGPFVNLFLGGTTTSYYRQPFSESALNAAYDAATGIYTYTFTTNSFPADATGSWSVSASTRQTVQLQKAVGGTIAYTEGAVNPVTYVSMTSAPAVPREVVVTLDRCNVCHANLSFLFSHGGQRIATQFCVICHNPNGSDVARRPADQAPPESISMQRMIHRIHTGDELTQNFTIYGFGGNPTNFNEVTYPGYRGNCVACHATGTYNIPAPTGELDVVTLRDYFTPQGPATAACLGCHDVRDAEAHAYLNTSPFGEACGTCHGANSDWSPDKVHAR